MIKQVFEDGNIQDHISNNNASDFYSESCFGIVFPEIDSLKISRESLNGYDFSEIPLNYQGPFQTSEDNGMRTFPREFFGNFVTNYLAYIAWDALLINSMRNLSELMEILFWYFCFYHFKRKQAIQFRRHRI